MYEIANAWGVEVIGVAQVQDLARDGGLHPDYHLPDASSVICLGMALPRGGGNNSQVGNTVRRLAAVKQETAAGESRLHAANFATSEAGETRASLQRVVAFIRREQQRLEQAIRELLAAHAQLRKQVSLLDTIPGIAWTTAVGLLGEIGDAARYRSPKALAAHAGLIPSQRTSGTSVRGKSTIGKEGSRALRRLLYMPALVAISHNPALREFYDRLRQRGKLKMVALVAAMHKLLRICWGVLKHQLPFQYPKPPQNP